LILHGVFTEVLLQSSDPPRALSNDILDNVLKRQNANPRKPALDDSDFAINPEQVIDLDDSDFAINPEQVIDSVIRKRLGLPSD
jgi:hypothetical protein